MEQGARKPRNSDGYKPRAVPEALKVVDGYKGNPDRKAEVEETMPHDETKSVEMLEDITGITCIYVPVRDVSKAIQWYETNLGCMDADKGSRAETNPTAAILRFPEQNGKYLEAGIRQTVPAMFLIQSRQWTNEYGFAKGGNGGNHPPIGCFITPRIQDMYNRFKQNGVDIISDIPDNRPCGPNFLFRDPDGNVWEIWQAI
ncbi:VOC family protein [Paenibacillus cymbidii]|uniref:VOC family protein n=1 Tax=Paenibacillus cymbidii TaxID=1639034 RepID=UPI001080735A|nr:VOC family protein [Paenibacillus cymbidii]